MNRKGFTMVELLAVIVLLSVIFAIALISYNEVFKNRRENDYRNIVSMIEENTKVLVTTDFNISNKVDSLLVRENDDEEKECKISYNLLIQKRLMDDETKDPRTGKIISTDSFIIVSLNENEELEYQFVNMDPDDADYSANVGISDSLVNCLN